MPEVEEQETQETSTEEPKSPEPAKIPEGPGDWADFEKLPAEEQERLIEEVMVLGEEPQEPQVVKPEPALEPEPTPSAQEPAKVEPKPPAPIQPPVTAEEKQIEDKIGKPPELPDEILQVDYTKFMPQGEEFDPHEALIAGTSSARARVRADAELAGRVQDFRQQQRDRQLYRETAEREFTEFVNRTPEMQSAEAQREYLDFAMTSTLENEVMTHEELLEMMKFIKYRRKQKRTSEKPKKSSTTAPVTAASSSVGPELKSDEDLEAVAISKIGPEVD